MTGPQDPHDPNYPAYGAPEPPAGPGYGAPPPGYGPPAGYQPAPAAGAPVRVRRRLPARVHARPEPKFGVSMAGIGVALVTVGVIIWGGDYLGHGISGQTGGVSDSHRLLGVALSLVAIAVGYTLTITQRTGPSRQRASSHRRSACPSSWGS